MSQDNTAEIIKTILGLMNVRFDSVEKVDDSGSKHFKYLIKTSDSSALIGPNGMHLEALNYVVRRIVNKTSDDDSQIKFIIDVNGYYERELDSLKAKAKIMSERARSFKVDVELDPMTSYERMIVHSYLEGIPEIKTESVGEGASRKIVIRYTGKPVDSIKI